MDKGRKFESESIFNIILTVAGLLIVVGSYQLGFGTLKNPGSGLFPFLAGLLMLIPNCINLFKEKSDKDEVPFNPHALKKFLFMAAVFVLWVVLIPFLGYIIVTFLATYAFAKIMGLEGWAKPLLLSATATATCYLFFEQILYSDLPRGLLG